MDKVQNVESIADLVSLLESHGIDLTQWDKGNAKTLSYLLNEIKHGESTLILDEKYGLIRQVEVVALDIQYIDKKSGKAYLLIENRQVFSDGRVRRRYKINSVAEKMKPGECPEEAARRGIKEELGIDDNIGLFPPKHSEYYRVSESYPDLLTRYSYNLFKAILSEKQYKKEGYIEDRSDCKTYFVWREIKE